MSPSTDQPRDKIEGSIRVASLRVLFVPNIMQRQPLDRLSWQCSDGDSIHHFRQDQVGLVLRMSTELEHIVT